MKIQKINLGQMITIGANLGVIAGIVFLGYELRQNNFNIQEAARYNVFQNRLSANLLITTDADVARLRYWQESDGSLSELDELRRVGLIHTYFLRWENDYQSYLSGVLDYESLSVAGMRGIWHSNSAFEEVWVVRKEAYGADFVQWVEENIANEE